MAQANLKQLLVNVIQLYNMSVNWIDAITIFTNFKNATVTFNFRKIPLQIYVSLRDAITPAYTTYTNYYTPYFQPYIRTRDGVYQNQQKKVS
jgi:hypothetical protein